MASIVALRDDRSMPRSARPRPESETTPPDAAPAETTTPPASESESTPPPTGGPGAGASAGDRFFGWLRGLDLRREPGWVGGVCAGIAARLGIDPLIVRGIAVVVAVLGGPAIFLYAVAWLLLPDTSDRIHLEDVFRGRFEPVVAAIAALIALSMLPLAQGFWFLGAGFWGMPDWSGSIPRTLWTLVVVGLLIAFVVWLARRSSTPPSGARPAPDAPTVRTAAAFTAAADGSVVGDPSASDTAPTEPTGTAADTPGGTPADVAAWRAQQEQVRAEQRAYREQRAANRAAARLSPAERASLHEAQRARERATRSNPLYSLIVIGLAFVAGGLAILAVGGAEPSALDLVVGAAVALAVLSVGIIVNGIRGKRAGGAAGVAWLLLIPLAFTGVTLGAADTAVRWGPVTTLTPAESQSFAIGAGRIELDLTGFDRRGADLPASVSLQVGAGDITVVVPDGVTVVFSGFVGAGSIDAEASDRRFGPAETVQTTYNPSNDTEPLVVSVHLGAGHIRVIGEDAP
jgi:phage shock protein PspC (stress-responsive transcriptional regulator)